MECAGPPPPCAPRGRGRGRPGGTALECGGVPARLHVRPCPPLWLCVCECLCEPASVRDSLCESRCSKCVSLCRSVCCVASRWLGRVGSVSGPTYRSPRILHTTKKRENKRKERKRGTGQGLYFPLQAFAFQVEITRTPRFQRYPPLTSPLPNSMNSCVNR